MKVIKNEAKRVVAVHDISGVGRVSMMAVVPILNSMGVQVCPLPTALLSCHTQFPEYTFLDLTDEMKRIIGKWKQLDFRFDAFYSGYLGSPEQVDIVNDFFNSCRRDDDLVVVDPVLGDNGRMYKGMDQEMPIRMRHLICSADVITPNVTEMFLLLDHPYSEDALGDEQLKQYMQALSDRGPQIVIITGVPHASNEHLTSVFAYNRVGHRFWKVTCPFLPTHYPGTGDAFTSVITGSLLQGDSLPIALDRATQFILQGIRATFGYEYNNLDGILLERVLPILSQPIQISSYELI